MKSNTRNPIVSMLVATAVLALLFWMLLGNLSSRSDEMEQRYKEVSAVNLDANTKASDIKNVLLLHGYVMDEADATVIARTLADSLKHHSLDKLYDLEKRDFQVSAAKVDTLGSPLLKARLASMRDALGFRDTLVPEALKRDYPSTQSIGKGRGRISATVKDDDKNACKGVLVRLMTHRLDSLGKPVDEPVTYARTDGKGQVVFDKLDEHLSYSVLPISEEYEYGTSRGTVNCTLADKENASLDCAFRQKDCRVRLFSRVTLRQIKDDQSFTCRTPEAYKNSVTMRLFVILLLWWVLFVLLRRRCRIRGEGFASGMVALLMFLTGFAFLLLCSVSNPFTESFFGGEQMNGIVIGWVLVALLTLSNFDLQRFYRDGYRVRFDFLYQLLDFVTGKKLVHNKVYGSVEPYVRPWAKGSSYLILALLLTGLLFTPLGREVGGMRVNLKLLFLPQFQPSEIAKYLIVLFMAAFFVSRIISIQRYSEVLSGKMLWGKVKMLAALLLGLMVLMGLYLRLGDMGPGLVVTVTFVLFYSIVLSKGQLGEGAQKRAVWSIDIVLMLVGTLLYIVFLWAAEKFMGLRLLGLPAWLAVWLAYCAKTKRLHESPLMMVAIISVFVFAAPLLKSMPWSSVQSVGQRFADRSEMCTNTWGHLDLHGDGMDPTVNNQVAEGCWGLASGGLTGQGMGQGSPNLIPAFHTDMILSSAGEQLGWIGLLVYFVAIMLLLRLALHTGYQTKNHFAFYLCLGISIATAVQLGIITFGSIGVIPLTGVTVPFLSYGSSSMVLNLAAFGMVLSLSRIRKEKSDPASDIDYQEIKTYRRPVMAVTLMFVLFVGWVMIAMGNIQMFSRNSILVRPLYVIAQRGDPVIEYNPRIAQLTKRLASGSIYDRNGLLLATSNPDSIHVRDYERAGVAPSQLRNLKKQKQLRYYPMGDHLFFMLGDVNSGVYFSYRESDPLGYMAEAQHLSYLRGYDNCMYEADNPSQPVRRVLRSDKYHPGRYLPAVEMETDGVIVRDYSALLPYLKAGVDSRKVSRLNERKRSDIKPKDLQLTLDATLQASLQKALADYAKKNGWDMSESYRLLRISAVVLNANNGELLSSACYPMPSQEVIKDHASEQYYRDQNRDKNFRAYTDRDLGLTYPTNPGSTAKVMSALAGLRRFGPEAINYKEYIYDKERVHAGVEPSGTVSMYDAIWLSSNCYFIHLVNHHELYPYLDTIYQKVGVRLDGQYAYTLNYAKMAPVDESADAKVERWHNTVNDQANRSYHDYATYMQQRNAAPKKMNRGSWQWCWGQGTLDATPLTMARVASVMANQGCLAPTRYLITDDTLLSPNMGKNIRVVSAASAQALRTAMHKQIDYNRCCFPGVDVSNMGGKTGTPERCVSGKKRINDGWYICYIDNATIRKTVGGVVSRESAPIAIAVRMERLPGNTGSGAAMRCVGNVVIPELRRLGYVNN